MTCIDSTVKEQTMAVIGSTLGLPKPSEVVSVHLLLTVLSLVAAGGLIWAIVDYGRMLLLYKKMVCGNMLLDDFEFD